MDIDEIFNNSFLGKFNEQEKKKNTAKNEERLVAEQKKRKLAPIAQLLDKLVERDVYVKHRDQFSVNTISLSDLKPQKFSYRYEESSQSWAPGISIIIEHPAQIEIAIPNKADEGVVKIHVSSTHPDIYLFQGTFNSFEKACESIAHFLSKSTTGIGKPVPFTKVEKKPINENTKYSQSYFSIKRGEDE